MNKIYRRSNLPKDTPKKKKDEHARVRNQILNFRTTPDERMVIEERIRLSGLPKSEFLIQSCMYNTINMSGSAKMLAEFKRTVSYLESKVMSINSWDEVDVCTVESIRMIFEIINGLKKSLDE